MSNLGLDNFNLEIRTYGQAFYYEVSFRFALTGMTCLGEGSAPSPSQCFDAAMAYLAECMREAVA